MPDREPAATPAAQPVPGKPGRSLYSTATKYEFQFGYSRAVRHGSVIRVSGTAGLGEDGQVVSDDVGGQLRRAIEIMTMALEALGADLGDVVMTRVYVADIRDADTVAVVHGEAFRDIRPATTVVKSEFVDARILVEIEAEAVHGGATARTAETGVAGRHSSPATNG